MYVCNRFLITPHTQREQGIGKALGYARLGYVGVHVFIYVCGQKKIESYFSDRLTFSFAVGLLVLFSPETFSRLWLSKLRIFLFNVHLALFDRRMT